MEKLLKYFMDETNKKFEALGKDISSVKDSIQDLREFKVSMMVSSRWVSLIVSTLVGIFTFFATLGSGYYLNKAKAEAKPLPVMKEERR